MAKAISYKIALFAVSFLLAQHAEASDLHIEQIGSGNVVSAYQGRGPEPDAVAGVLDLGATEPVFLLHDPTQFETDGEVASVAVPTDIASLLDGLPTGGTSRGSLHQHGNDNRAVAVQVGGMGNVMRTQQVGSRNRAFHLQLGGGNDTRLSQFGDDNTNALIARRGVTGPLGDPFFLEIAGSRVRGFSIDATGRQPYRGFTVSPTPTGLQIEAR